MKYYMEMAQMSIKKILNGTKKIDLRLFDEKRQRLRLDDVIEFYCARTRESVLCLVTGLTVFETFDEMIDVLPAELFGYPDKNEVKVRANRLFRIEEQLKNHVIGIFLTPIRQKMLEKEDEHNYFNREERQEIENLEEAEKEISTRRAYARQREENAEENEEKEPFNFEFVYRDSGYER